MVVMLPTLKIGLVADDLPQRAVELRPAQLPLRMHETGNPADSGSFSTVMFNLFGLNRDPQYMALMKNYGTLPWWTPDDLRLSLCRPVAAFTHWLDYRLFPDSPALMHAHNIAWFAVTVFLLTIVYRKLMGGVARRTGGAFVPAGWQHLLPGDVRRQPGLHHGAFLRPAVPLRTSSVAVHQIPFCHGPVGAIPGTFPFLGGRRSFNICLHSRVCPGARAGFFRSRAVTVLPSLLVLMVWRTVYILSGYGLSHEGLFYVDPLNEPFRFVQELFPG